MKYDNKQVYLFADLQQETLKSSGFCPFDMCHSFEMEKKELRTYYERPPLLASLCLSLQEYYYYDLHSVFFKY